ncbi:flavodoxin-dependent (E)-4-hydroxy-3-methylbut-2-enyl-diphosphate synthase [Thermanaeromonas sp. C210]|uniref:flavodoxin-dependent (E)-4-hydroxy-3-methylbut-2-enyl-diphosphate synthase n=1 Tax=Thermanaeromonas sp. C210 TaxID=2731925 RepID=UPI00155CAA6A|nr:flavodoxin-dependent (E)-4-hydroxy-3-methylbut-2-enyl-diphosphate synthase [Thermanaeromonas sp. C210]GFN23849.1 4-hydroxy-3-methylbut-2-en-1-yl diphosphate synthase, flavodoxin [Thermanaeromonas sp. C210]
MEVRRRQTRRIYVGKVAVGGGAPIVVQSMTNTDTRDVAATVDQIRRLEAAGCEIVRVAVPDREAARALRSIKAQTNLPLIADIHFDHRLALEALAAGADGLRINPGNIGGARALERVAREAGERGVPIRVGVNAGSLEREVMEAHGGITAEAMVESALRSIRLLENLGFFNIKVSLKASEVPLMVDAYRLLAQRVDYPLHLGVTEAGPLLTGAVKSAVGLGILLSEGIGDTIRVSLTGDPVLEVEVAYTILRSLGLRKRGVELISCPTCGRCQIDLEGLAARVEEKLKGLQVPLKVAVMGCAVNGPGEARQADVGIAGGRGWGMVFRQGEPVRRVPEEHLVDALWEEIDKILQEREERHARQ